MLHPLLLRLFEKNDRNFHFHHLAHPIFSDMMFASTLSRRINRCAQVYATNFGWAIALPMASRSDACETLLFMFARDGVLPACICNNHKEMIQGKFHQKLKDAALMQPNHLLSSFS